MDWLVRRNEKKKKKKKLTLTPPTPPHSPAFVSFSRLLKTLSPTLRLTHHFRARYLFMEASPSAPREGKIERAFCIAMTRHGRQLSHEMTVLSGPRAWQIFN